MGFYIFGDINLTAQFHAPHHPGRVCNSPLQGVSTIQDHWLVCLVSRTSMEVGPTPLAWESTVMRSRCPLQFAVYVQYITFRRSVNRRQLYWLTLTWGRQWGLQLTMPYSFNIASGIVGMKIAEYAALDTAYILPMYQMYCLLATRYAGILNILRCSCWLLVTGYVGKFNTDILTIIGILIHWDLFTNTSILVSWYFSYWLPDNWYTTYVFAGYIRYTGFTVTLIY